MGVRGHPHKTVKEALFYVRDHPEAPENMLEAAAYELVCRALVTVASNPSVARGGINRANKAQRIILDRTVGTRKPGSLPIVRQSNALQYDDLTQGAINL
jgi:hypothetical protein